jgi:hypothetical protein
MLTDQRSQGKLEMHLSS